MASPHDLVERQMADVDLRPFTIDDFHQRRHRKEHRRRIATAAMGLVLVGAVVGGVIQARGQDDQQVASDVLGGTPSPFAGEWASTDNDGSSQTMDIRQTDGDEHHVTLHDDAAAPCTAGPSTESGTGRARSVTELVVSLVLTCDDAGSPEDGESRARLTFTHDRSSDTLTDTAGVVWQRRGAGAPSAGATPALGSSPYPGTWVVAEAGQYFPDVLEIRLLGDGDLHQVVMRKAETPQCADGASTMSGTGSRQVDDAGGVRIVRLLVDIRLTCDDGSDPVPQTAAEEVISGEFGISFAHDPETDSIQGSLGSTFVRQDAVASTDQ